MELKDRLDILIQGAELAQKGGVLTLDDAVVVKTTIDNIKTGNDVKNGVEVLANIVGFAQKKGVYALQDAHYLYLALENIYKELEEIPIVEEPKESKKKKSEN